MKVLDTTDGAFLFHNEIIYRNGKDVGYMRACSYGHTIGGPVGLACVDGKGEVVNKQMVDSSKWEVDIAGRRYPIEVSLRPFYDPDNVRIKM